MPPLELPRCLVENEARHPVPGRAAWLAGLPDTVAAVAERWRLWLDPPYQPGGQCAWVAPATGPDGHPYAVKVGWTHEEGRDEAAGLRSWAGRGTVEVYDSWLVGETTALLLERCDPGTPLRGAVPEAESDEVVAGVLRRLWQAPTDGPFRPLIDMCAWWADEYEQKLSAAPGHPLDPGLSRAGMELFRTLPRDADRTALLATDLHAENILAAQREPWLLVDPKPYVGDPAYDPLQHLLNCPDRLSADPDGLVRRLAALCDLDPERLRRWAFARAVQESVDSPWLVSVAERLRP